jgi:hypothetical protein
MEEIINYVQLLDKNYFVILLILIVISLKLLFSSSFDDGLIIKSLDAVNNNLKDINKTNYNEINKLNNEINKLNNEVKSSNKKLNDLLNMHTIKFKQDLDVSEGVIYKGTVKEIIEYGAWVEITPTTKGLLHISEISWEYVNNVEDVLKLGQEIEVELISIDSGEIKLSRRALLTPGPYALEYSDNFFEDAALIVVQSQTGSTSMIQRKLKLGYNRAGRIIDELEAVGVLGAFYGSKARKVLIKNEIELKELLSKLKKIKDKEI